jgi:ABC-type multidrug transport system ATPase subunit
MITITNLSKRFKGDVTALHDINLEFGDRMFGLLGANGAGKTTLMRIIAGLMKPSMGRVEVAGNDVASQRGKAAIRAMLGYLPQDFDLYPTLTAAEFLDYVAVLKGITDKAQRGREVERVLEDVRLTDAASRRLKGFSGGMKQRVGIAQALLGSPKLLIVDEPTAGLDPEERVHLRNLLSDMAQNCTVLLSTHIVEDISHSCNDLAVIQKGEVVFRGSPRALIERVQGKVWHVTTQGERPNGGVSIVSTIQVEDGVRYRVLGEPNSAYDAVAARPNLEDGYIWLMRDA